MAKQPNKLDPRSADKDTFDLKEAKASYIGMPTWQRFAIWFALGLILLGIIGDLIW